MARGLSLLLVGLIVALPVAGHADQKEDAAFKKRFATLEKKKDLAVLQVRMAPTDDPNVLPAQHAPTGPVLVANTRMGIYTPPLISPADIQTVVNGHMKDLRTCYKAQLAEDPEWADNMILDLAVKKTGRVSEVDVSPGRVRRSTIGKCLMSRVPKWRFPEFTGETDEGITQEVVNASFPFSFSVSQ